MPFSVNAQRVVFYLNQLVCNKTTEEAQDEIYFIVAYRYNINNGNIGEYRLGTWDINDGKQPRTIGGINLFDGVIYPNTSVDFTVFIMEQDGGGASQIISKANEVLTVVKPIACNAFPPSCPFANAISGVVSFVNSLPDALKNIIKDTDDYIGSFSVRLSADNTGFLSGYYYNFNRCTGSGPAMNVPNPNLTLVSTFNGDGSNYVLTATASYIPQ